MNVNRIPPIYASIYRSRSVFLQKSLIHNDNTSKLLHNPYRYRQNDKTIVSLYNRKFAIWSNQEGLSNFSWKTALLIFFGIPFTVYLYKCTMLVLFQNKLIYMPFLPFGTRKLTLEEMRIDKRLECKQVTIETRDKCKLAGIIVKARKVDNKITDVMFDDLEPIIIYFQGNAGNMLFRIPIFTKLILYSTNIVKNLQIVAIGYRGYWFSTGSPSEKGLKIDALAIYDSVRALYPKNPIYIYGHSLGGAVALYLASNEKIQKDLKGIIIENAFTSIKDMVTTIYPQKWLPYKYLVNIPFLNRNKWDNYHMIQGIKIPILFLSSRNDEIVPQEQMIELHKKAKMSKKKVWIEFENALHEDIYSHKGFVEAIKVFINESISDHDD